MYVHPILDLTDELIRIFGMPALLAVLVWAIRSWDGGQRAVKEIGENTRIAVKGVETVNAKVDLMQSNHLAHLQEGINQVAESNNEAVRVLNNIDKGIGVLVDRGSRS